VQKLTKEILNIIIKDPLESMAEFKIYFRSVRKDKKLIQTMVKWKLKRKIKYKNKLKKKKCKISQFGIPFRKKHESENLEGKIMLETYQYTRIREEEIFINSKTRNAKTPYNSYSGKYIWKSRPVI
jgi:cell division protein YceG involved in septum cleavage